MSDISTALEKHIKWDKDRNPVSLFGYKLEYRHCGKWRVVGNKKLTKCLNMELGR